MHLHHLPKEKLNLKLRKGKKRMTINGQAEIIPAGTQYSSYTIVHASRRQLLLEHTPWTF